MCIGYTEKVNKIIVIRYDDKPYIIHLGVYGLNICGENYSYYDKQMQLHILDTKYIKEIKLYNDKNYIYSVEGRA